MLTAVLTEVAAGAAEGLRRVLTNSGEVEIIGYARDGLEAAQMAINLRPDALIIHQKLPGISGIEVCKLVSIAAPEVGCILLQEDAGEKAIRKAMMAGARATLSADGDVGRLLQTLSEVGQVKAVRATHDYQLATDPAEMPITVALASAKDGVGKTTIAVNLATVFARRYPDQVVLIDYYAQLGDVALCLNLQPRNSLVDLAAYAFDIDGDVVDMALTTHESSLRVLAGSTMPQPVWLDSLNVPYIANLLGAIRRKYRFVFCDLPPLLWPASLYTLSRCQRVLAVAGLFDLPTVHDTATLVTMLMNGYVGREKLRLLVNRQSRRDTYSIADLEQACGIKVAYEVPNETNTVVSAFNKGVPFVIGQPTSALAVSIEHIADALEEDFRSLAHEFEAIPGSVPPQV